MGDVSSDLLAENPATKVDKIFGFLAAGPVLCPGVRPFEIVRSICRVVGPRLVRRHSRGSFIPERLNSLIEPGVVFCLNGYARRDLPPESSASLRLIPTLAVALPHHLPTFSCRAPS